MDIYIKRLFIIIVIINFLISLITNISSIKNPHNSFPNSAAKLFFYSWEM